MIAEIGGQSIVSSKGSLGWKEGWHSRASWRNCMQDVHGEGWQEEAGGKSSLNWYKLAKEEFGLERYVKEFGSKREV